VIFDNGFCLSIQNAWKNSPIVHYMPAGTKKLLKAASNANFLKSAQKARGVLRHEL